MAETDYAWAAGFIDGEGCLSISKSKGLYTSSLIVNQRDIEPLDRLVSIFGGKIVPYLGVDKTTRYHRWRVYSKNFFEVVDKVYPYLTLKKSQAKVIQEFKRTYADSAKSKKVSEDTSLVRESCYKKLLDIKKDAIWASKVQDA